MNRQNPVTSNYLKYTSRNLFKKFFLNNFQNTLISLILPISSEKILDAGCGEGFILHKLYELKVGKSLEGIDSSKIAIKTGKKLHPYLNLKQANIYNLPYKDNSFDLVISTEVLEHLQDPEKALKELKRVSKKYLILTVPNEPWFTLFNFTQWGKYIGHINHWSSSSFEKFITHNSSLRTLSVKRPFPWTMILLQKTNFPP